MRRKALLSWTIVAATGLLAAPAQATLCKYVDDKGHVTYSDAVVKGATKANCFEAPPVPPPPPPQQRTTAPSTTPAPSGGLPNVDPATQKKRDESRRKILESELATEGLQPEEWGGSTQFAEVSAREKLNLDELLENEVRALRPLDLEHRV